MAVRHFDMFHQRGLIHEKQGSFRKYLHVSNLPTENLIHRCILMSPTSVESDPLFIMYISCFLLPMYYLLTFTLPAYIFCICRLTEA